MLKLARSKGEREESQSERQADTHTHTHTHDPGGKSHPATRRQREEQVLNAQQDGKAGKVEKSTGRKNRRHLLLC